MKISVICLASRNGGGLTILRDLYSFALQGADDTRWQFVLSDQDLGRGSEDVSLVKTAPAYKGWFSRIWAELTSARRAVNEFDPDIVLSLQNIDSPARGRKPLAIYMHQSLPFSEVKFSLFRRAERALAIRQKILGPLIRRSVNRSAVTFVQTEWIAASLGEACPEARIESLGYVLPSVNDRGDNSRGETTSLVYPASAALYKDHQTLYKAVTLWRARCDDPGPVILTITRDSFEKLVGALTEEEAGWYSFIGSISHHELRKIYESSVLLFPSYVETLGLPLYEGMAARCPIVAANTAPSREALANYPDSFLFEPRSAESMSVEIEKAWDSRDDVRFSEFLEQQTDSDPWTTMLDKLRFQNR